MAPPSGIQSILSGLGLSEKSVDSIKLSRGVVGRTTYAIIGLLGLLGVVAARIAPDLLLWLAGFGVVAFVIYFIGVLRFAHKNPGAALLEGAELLRWKAIELAAKGTGPMSSTVALPAPPKGELPPSSDDL